MSDDRKQELGCGDDLRVLIMRRGGGTLIAEVKPDRSGTFERALDRTTDATIDVPLTSDLGALCCEDVAEIYPWQSELVIFRDGRDAWAGPITEIDASYDNFHIEASDLTAWYSRRPLPSLKHTNTDLAGIFQAYHDAALAPDPSPNFDLTTTPTGILGDREVVGNDDRYAADAIQELADTGLDYSAYGRSIIVGGQEIAASPFVTLMDHHWTEPPHVVHRGNLQATQVIVRGSNGAKGIATASQQELDFYGLLVRTFDEPDILDSASATRAAQTRLDFLRTPVYIESGGGGRLSSSAPITLPELIPGIRVRVQLESSCRPLVQDFRLESVNGNFAGEIDIKLQPLGTIDESLLI